MMQPTAEETFGQLFEEHRHGVYAYLLGRVGDPESARDLLQETFLRVWRCVDDVGDLPADRQRAWIFTAARNLVTDTYRSRATRQATRRALGDRMAVAVPEAEQPEARAQTAERVRQVGAAIRELPEESRIILAMHVAGELTSAQIGVALGQPAGTIRYKLARARQRLAASLHVTDAGGGRPRVVEVRR